MSTFTLVIVYLVEVETRTEKVVREGEGEGPLEADCFKDQLTNYEKHQRGCLREVRVRIKLPGPSPALTHLPAVHPDPT